MTVQRTKPLSLRLNMSEFITNTSHGSVSSHTDALRQSPGSQEASGLKVGKGRVLQTVLQPRRERSQESRAATTRPARTKDTGVEREGVEVVSNEQRSYCM